jgi:hypothetical protein
MTELSSNLIVRGENVQSLYNNYVGEAFVVNRRYQRKLVWTDEEKQAFIDSIRKQLPVPLILTAERNMNYGSSYEIIDGLQRLNAIFSFIENVFASEGQFFDLETLAETKLRRDDGLLVQKKPVLPRTDCVKIANYVLPISTYRAPSENLVEEVFRRINSNGRYLSRQEIRQAGCVSNFADIVRDVSCFIRGDASARDLVKLTAMQSISISNRPEQSGIFIEDVFWVKHRILEKDQVRESRDEEIVADLMASMTLETMPRYASETLDTYYGLPDRADRRNERIEAAVQRDNPELIRERFEFVHGEIEAILNESGRNFVQLIFRQARQRVPRYYEAIFLGLYTLLIRDNRQVTDRAKVIRALEGCGDRVLNVPAGGGTWSAESKRLNVASVVELLREFTEPASARTDLLFGAYESRIDRLLTASLTENSLFELKQGFHGLDAAAIFNARLFDKVLATMSAIANDSPGVNGYVIIGIADDSGDARRHESMYGLPAVRTRGFYVTGIDPEVAQYGLLDDYIAFLSNKITSSQLDSELAANIVRDMRPVRFHDRTVVLFSVNALDHPVAYDNKWYERQGPLTREVEPRDVGRIFTRFAS